MCREMEALREEGREEAQTENAIKMLKLHLLTYEQIAECTGLTLDKVLELAGQTSEAENSEKR